MVLAGAKATVVAAMATGFTEERVHGILHQLVVFPLAAFFAQSLRL